MAKTSLRRSRYPDAISDVVEEVTDTSWGNDQLDSLAARRGDLGFKIWVDDDDPAQREYPDDPKYLVHLVRLVRPRDRWLEELDDALRSGDADEHAIDSDQVLLAFLSRGSRLRPRDVIRAARTQ